MSTVARIKKDGSLLLKNTISERLPVVTDGLIAHYPLDGAAGAIDVINGKGTLENLESNINILDALLVTWKTASIWQNNNITWDENEQALKAVNGCEGYASNFITIDTTKSYYLEADVKLLAGSTGVLYYGYRFYDANFSEIGIGQHHGTYDYSGCSSYTPTTTWTHVNNSGIGGAAKTGEGDNGNSVFHTGTKYIRLLFLFNYGGTGTTWVKNLRMCINNSNTSNTIITENGVAVQEATTNLLPNPITLPISDWQARENVTVTYNQVDPFGKPYAIKIHPNSSVDNYFGSRTTGSLVQGTTYTSSIWLRATKPCTISLNIGNTETTNLSLTTYWQKFITTRTITNGNSNYYHIGGWNTWSDQSFDVFLAYPQLEQRTYASSFVSGSSLNGSLTIPIKYGTGNFTILHTFIPHANSNLISDQRVFLDLSNGLRLATYQQVPYINGNELVGAGGNNIHVGFNTLSNEKCVSIIIKNGDSFIWRIKTDDGQDVSWTKIHTAVSTYNLQNISMINSWSGVHSNLSVYNRVLTEKEISALLGEGFKVGTTRAITPLLIESPVIPLDSYYFPLASDTKDSSKTIDSVDNTNVVFENNCAWVGTPVNNIITNVNLNLWNRDGSGQGVLGSTKPIEGIGISISDFASNTRLSDTWKQITLNTNYTISTELLKISGTPTFRWQIGGLNSSGAGVETIWTQNSGNFTRDIGGWQYISNTFSFSTPTISQICHWFQDGEDYLTYTHSFYLKNPMLVNKSFRTPFVNGNRGGSSLEYDFNSSIGLDWNGDWTICYWKKPIATPQDNLIYYNLDSLGCNSNSVGGGFCGTGKGASQNNFICWMRPIYSGEQICRAIPSNYFNNWEFITIKKLGSVIYFINNNDILQSYEVGTIANNYFVTQYGYDFKLGGWDNGNPTNTYFRDLIVVKRALSNIELNNIYKQMSIYKSKAHTQNIIEEGL